MLVGGLTWVFGSILSGQTENYNQRIAEPKLDNFLNWPIRYRALEGDENYVINLSFFKGFSESFTKASGKTVVNFKTGQVSVKIKGLPILEDEPTYEVLFVDNRPGPGNSVALDLGPGGDDVISLGSLNLQETYGTLERFLDTERLGRFELDMVVVRRLKLDGSTEFVIGGLAELFYKLNHRISGEVLQSVLTNMIEEGGRLFFDETFEGNGRTCSTCHRTNDNLGLSPGLIATLPSNDLLFVAESVAALSELENPTLMRGGRALILENIDGFQNPHVFRATPALNNLLSTAPYGLSAEFPTIQVFTTGAVMQHFTKNTGGDPENITRVAGMDFRLPTQAELDAMEAFQLAVFLPNNKDFNLDNIVSEGSVQQQGRELFFGSALCSRCHGGTVLSDADGALGGGNLSFNTGVVNLPINGSSGDNLPSEDNGNREFSTPQLFGVANTAPFFHDHSVTTLADAVAFYDGIQFNTSPAAAQVGIIQITPTQIAQIVAFLQALDNTCAPPPTGDWIVTNTCTFEGSASAAGSVILEGNVVLTIAVNASLNIDFSNHHLIVKDGGKVLIKNGGKVF
jgi:cytochrome c peroxidase